MAYITPNFHLADDVYRKLETAVISAGQRFILLIRADRQTVFSSLETYRDQSVAVEAVAQSSIVIQGGEQAVTPRMGDYTLAVGGVFLGPGGALQAVTRLALAVAALGASYSLVNFTTADESTAGNMAQTVREVAASGKSLAEESRKTLWLILLIFLAYLFAKHYKKKRG